MLQLSVSLCLDIESAMSLNSLGIQLGCKIILLVTQVSNIFIERFCKSSFELPTSIILETL